ncbi:MAG: hypothetical protein NTV86_20720, partial [Planctomycetota bacterium]|nr:hypothetical protein [Planctomycetota bacterium]
MTRSSWQEAASPMAPSRSGVSFRTAYSHRRPRGPSPARAVSCRAKSIRSSPTRMNPEAVVAAPGAPVSPSARSTLTSEAPAPVSQATWVTCPSSRRSQSPSAG